MSYVYALLVIIVLSLIFVLSCYLNSKVKVDCDNNEMCEGCSINNCYHKITKED